MLPLLGVNLSHSSFHKGVSVVPKLASMTDPEDAKDGLLHIRVAYLKVPGKECDA